MKRLLCAILALALVAVCAACSSTLFPASSRASSSMAAESGTESPVKVTEAYANAKTVAGSGTTSAAPAPEAGTEPVPTPATGDFPTVPLIGSIGLILICAAGLVMLRHI